MSRRSKDIDIATNLKIVEWLKADLVDSVGTLFKALLKTGNEATSDALAAIIIIIYLLGRKVGLSFQSIDAKVVNKLNLSLVDSFEEEHWYGDLEDLVHYLENKKR